MIIYQQQKVVPVVPSRHSCVHALEMFITENPAMIMQQLKNIFFIFLSPIILRGFYYAIRFISAHLLFALFMCLFFFFSFFCSFSYAANFGTYGHTYPITEPNLLTVIHKQLAYMQKTGELKQLENKAKADVKKSVQRPRPTIISTTTKPKQFFYTPSLVVPQNLYDGKGNLLYQQGTQINALDQSTYPKVLQKYHFSLPRWTGIWVFINADDQAQLNWVKRHEAQWQQKYSMGVKVVLTGGNVKTTTKALKHYVYFDQYGKISEKLGIEHVPSVLTQDKKTPRFLIQEIDVSKA